jgi:tetratricopeptide (TPR) repeat protein/transcriptional regulator with XRE-family HTH domain
MRSFAELLSEYMARTGISDAELARGIGVRRQTIFRWKEGLVSRPRHREDVLRCAQRLRLTPEERDALLVAAGFPPANAETVPPVTAPHQPVAMSSAQVSETAVPEATEPGRFRSPLSWVIVIAALVAVGGSLFLAAQSIRLPGTYPVAGEGETLIVVGQFVNYIGGPAGYNVAGRVRDALEREIEAAQLVGVRVAVWPEEIRDAVGADAVGQRAEATVVIWGEYDSGRILTRFTVPGARSEPDERQLEELVASPLDLSATINSALPSEVRYMALLTLGQLYADQENHDQARAVLGQALAQPPAESDAVAALHFHLGHTFQVGEPTDLDQAIHHYSQVITLQPEWVTAYNNRGVAYLDRGKAGDLDRAIEDLNHAIKAKSSYAVAHVNRGVAYLKRDGPDDLTRALDDFSRAVDLAPDAPKAYINRGVAYMGRGQTGDLERAMEDFDRAIDLAPDAPGGYLNRGLAYVRAGERERWLADFERVLALAPKHGGAYNALCWAYALDQEPDLALPYCDQAVALDPTGYSRDSRGLVYAELGRLEEAAQDFEAFLDWLGGQPEGAYRRHGPMREAWVQTLTGGQNPIDQETLEQLRLE